MFRRWDGSADRHGEVRLAAGSLFSISVVTAVAAAIRPFVVER
jgi:hypothetical protein